MSDDPPSESRPTGWWAVSGESLLEALRRVAKGEHPDVVYMELLANARTDPPEEAS